MVVYKMMRFLWLIITIPLLSNALNSTDNNTDDEAEVLTRRQECVLKYPIVTPYFTSSLEMPLSAHGCSVPFQGFQGHGQHPEEIHIIRLTTSNNLKGTEKSPREVIVWLDAALCAKSVAAVNSSFLKLQPSSPIPSPFRNFKQGVSRKKRSLKTLHRIHRVAEDPYPLPSPASSTLNEATRKKRAVDRPDPRRTLAALVEADSSLRKEPAVQSRPLVLILMSDRPLRWKLMEGDCWKKPLASQVHVLVNNETSVESDLPIEVVNITWNPKQARKSIQRYVRRMYSGVASYTEVDGSANILRVLIGSHGPAHYKGVGFLRNKANACDFNSKQNSLSVSASLQVPGDVQGCLFGIQAGKLPQNVLVVDIDWLTQYFSPIPKLPPEIAVVLEGKSQNKSSETPKSDSNHFTLVLHSNRPVRWKLSTNRIHENITVITGETDSVQNKKMATNVRFVSRSLPSSRVDLLQMISSEFGPLVFFTTSGYAANINILIYDTLMQDLYEKISSASNLTSHGSSATGIANLTTKPKLPPYFLSSLRPAMKNLPISSSSSDDDDDGDTVNILQSSMTVICSKGRLEVYIPLRILIQLGIYQYSLHLNDRSCGPQFNDTHAFLRSSIASCGSSSFSDGKAFLNYVHGKFTALNSDDEDLEGSGVSPDQPTTSFQVPVVCHDNELSTSFRESTMHSNNDPDEEIYSDEDEEDKNSLSVNNAQDAVSTLYHLELYKDRILSQSLYLDSSKENSPTVQSGFNETLYVRAWMDGVSSVRVVAESCWVDSKSHADENEYRSRIMLIQNSCPSHESVRLESPPLRSGSAATFFSIRVNEEFSNLGQKIYLHCSLGLCASNPEHEKGNLVHCVDAQQYCSPQTLRARQRKPVVRQTLTRGPVIVIQKKINQFFRNLGLTNNKCTGVTVISSEELAMALSTEMAVAVAICSFFIGVGLTAALWCIHTKTDPRRHRLHVGEHSLGSRSANTSSSLSPHSHSGCSSTNSQCAIHT